MDQRLTLLVATAFLAGGLAFAAIQASYSHARHPIYEYRTAQRHQGVHNEGRGGPIELEDEKVFEDSKVKDTETWNGIESTIGNTPLIKIRSLSEFTGCEILAKAEVLSQFQPCNA